MKRTARSRCVGCLMAVGLLAGPVVAFAAETEAIDPRVDKFIAYAGCALSLMSIPETGGITVAAAVLTCGQALAQWWDK